MFFLLTCAVQLPAQTYVNIALIWAFQKLVYVVGTIVLNTLLSSPKTSVESVVAYGLAGGGVATAIF